MTQSLKTSSIKGLFWSLIDSIGYRSIHFIVGIILARLLVPEMFGLLAMLMIIIVLCEVLMDSGFGAALIQKHNIDDYDICSTFYFNIAIGILTGLLLFISAPIIAAFYNQPLISPMARVMSFMLVIDALGIVQANLLVRNMQFKARAKITFTAHLLAGAIGIVMAFGGLGVWSLVVQQLAASTVRTSCFWFFCNWKPKLLFSVNSLRVMLKFSLSILATSLLSRITESTYYLIIGKLFSAYDLGIFSRSQQLQGFASGTLSMIIGRVTFSTFSKMQHKPDEFRNVAQKTLTLVAFILFPIMAGIASVAEPLVIFLLTSKWSDTIPCIQLLCISGVLQSFDWIRQRIIHAAGRPDLTLKAEVISKIILFFLIAFSWRWGLYGIIAAIIFASLISFSINLRYLAKVTEYSVKKQLFDMLPYATTVGIMTLLVFLTSFLVRTYHPLLQIIIQSTVGCIFYIGVTWLFQMSAPVILHKEIKALFQRAE